MGNTFTSKGTTFIEEFAASYSFDRTINDPRLGQINLYQGTIDSQEFVAVKHYNALPSAVSQQSLNTFEIFMASNGNFIENSSNSNSSSSSSSEHPNVARVFAVDLSSSDEMKIYYEHFHTSVKNQIELRTPNRFHFSPEEIWRTSLSVIMAGYYLETQGRYIGEINTRKIFINKKGIVKIAPHMQSENDIDSFRRVAFYKQPTLVSPECLDKLRRFDYSPDKINHYKNDVFGLGLSVLEMASLEDSLTLYDFHASTLLEDLLATRLNKVERYYGSYFRQFLEKMLVREEQMRYSFSQLFQELLPYQQQIITGHKFYEIEHFRLSPPSPQRQKISQSSLLKQQPQPIDKSSTSSSQTQIPSSQTPSTYYSSGIPASAPQQYQSNFSINLTPCIKQEQQQQQPIDVTPTKPFDHLTTTTKLTATPSLFIDPNYNSYQSTRTHPQFPKDYTPQRSISQTSGISTFLIQQPTNTNPTQSNIGKTYVVLNQQQHQMQPSSTSSSTLTVASSLQPKVLVPVKTITLSNNSNVTVAAGPPSSFRQRVDSTPSYNGQIFMNPGNRFPTEQQSFVITPSSSTRQIIDVGIISARNRSISPQTVIVSRAITPSHRITPSNQLSLMTSPLRIASQINLKNNNSSSNSSSSNLSTIPQKLLVIDQQPQRQLSFIPSRPNSTQQHQQQQIVNIPNNQVYQRSNRHFIAK